MRGHRYAVAQLAALIRNHQHPRLRFSSAMSRAAPGFPSSTPRIISAA
jgi:hypothetical protein